MRNGEWPVGSHATDVYGIMDSTQLLIGKQGTGTGWHLDWSRSTNVALKLLLSEDVQSEVSP